MLPIVLLMSSFIALGWINPDPSVEEDEGEDEKEGSATEDIWTDKPVENNSDINNEQCLVDTRSSAENNLYVEGELGEDTLLGGCGDDTIIGYIPPYDAYIDLDEGDLIDAGPGSDEINAGKNDNVRTGNGSDTIVAWGGGVHIEDFNIALDEIEIIVFDPEISLADLTIEEYFEIHVQNGGLTFKYLSTGSHAFTVDGLQVDDLLRIQLEFVRPS